MKADCRARRMAGRRRVSDIIPQRCQVSDAIRQACTSEHPTVTRTSSGCAPCHFATSAWSSGVPATGG